MSNPKLPWYRPISYALFVIQCIVIAPFILLAALLNVHDDDDRL